MECIMPALSSYGPGKHSANPWRTESQPENSPRITRKSHLTSFVGEAQIADLPGPRPDLAQTSPLQ